MLIKTEINSGMSNKLMIKFEDIEEEDLHPHCRHGPALLFYGENTNPLEGFYACSAFRDKKLCNFHLAVNEVKPKHLIRNFPVDTKIYKQLKEKFFDNTYEKQKHYCLDCNVPLKESDLTAHLGHKVERNLTEEQIQNPTLFLPPLNNDKANAQYFFDDKALMFFEKCFRDLKIDKIVCMGAPRLHAYVRSYCNTWLSSFLLDLDQRFFYFYDDHEFAWYNMCNNYFFDDQQKPKFLRFLKIKRSQRLLFFTDPPFGCRTEPIAYTLYQLTKLFNQINQLPYQPVSIFWIYPYYSEHYIQMEMPSLQMCDYKINYTNHLTYTDMGQMARKLGSPVRLYTNVPLQLIKLPVLEQYKYCRICQRYTASENRHCYFCNKCPSKNGATYRHCQQCGICVKPNYVHCDECRRCTQSEGHNCADYQMNQRCWICRRHGHIEKNCSTVQQLTKFHIFSTPTKENVIMCYLCGVRGHNESYCPQRYVYLEETSFLNETRIKFRL